jgi:hypothetical protein
MYEDALISFDTQCTIQHRCILGVFVVSLIEGCSDASLLQASAILIGGGCRIFALKHCSIYFGHHKANVSATIHMSLEVPHSFKKLIPFLHIIIIPSGIIKLLL